MAMLHKLFELELALQRVRAQSQEPPAMPIWLRHEYVESVQTQQG